MKNKILIIILLFINYCLNAQYTQIPDFCFESILIETGIDTEGIEDGQVLTSDISSVTELFLDDPNNNPLFCVSDLTGIEDFTSLISLECDFNNIINLDLTGAVNLKYLSCSHNEMETLIINQNTELEIIFCATNNLTSLDISQNINLKEIYAFQNQLTSIDISNNLQIEIINLSFNQLTNFIAGNNINLETLVLGQNLLTSINLNGILNLKVFSCSFNFITNLSVINNLFIESIGCEHNEIVNLDLSNLNNLKILGCRFNQLTSLDIRNDNNNIITDFLATNNPNLTCIFVDNTEYSTTNWLDIDGNSTFVETELECETLLVNDFTLNNISIYPNPTKDILFIENSNSTSIEFIKIYNMFGQQVLFKKDEFNKINLSELKPALYLVTIKTEKGIINTKIVKK